MIQFYLKYELAIAFILLIAGFILDMVGNSVRMRYIQDSDSLRYKNPKKAVLIYTIAGAVLMALALVLGFRGGYIQNSFEILTRFM